MSEEVTCPYRLSRARGTWGHTLNGEGECWVPLRELVLLSGNGQTESCTLDKQREPLPLRSRGHLDSWRCGLGRWEREEQRRKRTYTSISPPDVSLWWGAVSSHSPWRFLPCFPCSRLGTRLWEYAPLWEWVLLFPAPSSVRCPEIGGMVILGPRGSNFILEGTESRSTIVLRWEKVHGEKALCFIRGQTVSASHPVLYQAPALLPGESYF